MISAVLDTNTVLSGLLWRGNPGRALDAARTGRFRLISSETLIAELEDVLSRPKFIKDLSRINLSVASFLENDFRILAQVVETPHIERVVLNDIDDGCLCHCGKCQLYCDR